MHSAYCTTCINIDVKINAVAGFIDISVFLAVAGAFTVAGVLSVAVVLAVAGVRAVAYCTFLLSLASLLLMLQSYVPALAGVPTVNFYTLLLAPLLWLASLHGKHPCCCWCNFR
jgi:hypothetical protein